MKSSAILLHPGWMLTIPLSIVPMLYMTPSWCKVKLEFPLTAGICPVLHDSRRPDFGQCNIQMMMFYRIAYLKLI